MILGELLWILMENTSWEGSWRSQVAKIGSKGSQEGTKGVPRGPKEVPRRLQGRHKEAKRDPGLPPEVPRGAHLRALGRLLSDF